MFGYLFQTAWRSLKRNPFLSILVVVGIGLGIGVSTTFVTTFYRLSGHPIPEKMGRLYFVQMDAWNPDRPWDDDDPDNPPGQLTYMDALAVTQSDIPTYATAMFQGRLTVHPESKELRPFRVSSRQCRNDFFSLFDVPFLFGGPWDDAADEGQEQVVVLDAETNQKLFGGEDPTGRTVRLEDREFTVVGVLAPWRPVPKYYDVSQNQYGDPEGLYVPFSLAEPMEIASSGNSSSWKSAPSSGYAGRLASETIWIQAWVQLDTPEQHESYQAFIDAYALEQRELGRFGRPINNKLSEVLVWLEHQQVVPEEATTMLIVALLFLVVCSVNLIGILLGKFLARAPEISVRRALGASRRAIFSQHLIESELIAVVGGGLGLLLSILGLRGLEMLFQADLNFKLDLNMMLAGIVLALFAGLLAGIYPAWRVCRIPPADYLKAQ